MSDTKKPRLPRDTEVFRVLLVEDDFDTVQLLLTVLGPLKLECYYAQDGQSGLEEFNRIDPHLMLLDLTLTGVTGRDVLQKVRETSYIPVIVLTDARNVEAALLSFKFGADDFLTKPIDVKVLSARVLAQLRRAYRYVEPVVVAQEATPSPDLPPKPSSSGTPRGWATCDMCGYKGPSRKFEKENALGQRSMECPNCKETDYIIFALS